ncbi:MAG: hypothetical protein JST16_01485 [Bdellovibrionales bacterium]|nr:hypothetical protein [Bdellovibrionales bacterium]
MRRFLIGFALVGLSSIAQVSTRDEYTACKHGQVAFNLSHKFSEPTDQSGGTCFGEGPTALMQSALYDETGQIFPLSAAVTLCNYYRSEDARAHTARNQAVRERGKNYIDGGHEDIVAQNLLQQNNFHAHSPDLQKQLESYFKLLTAEARAGKLSAERRDCILSNGLRKCTNDKTRIVLDPKVLASLEHRMVMTRKEFDTIRGEELKTNGAPGPATPYIEFINTYGHPRTTEQTLANFMTALNPKGQAELKNVHSLSDLKTFATRLRKHPRSYMSTSSQLSNFAELRDEMFAISPNNKNRFALHTVGKTFETLLAANTFPSQDFQQMMPQLRSRYASLLKSCDEASAPVRERILSYLCAGIPVMAGMDMEGVRLGPQNKEWTDPPQYAKGGAHVMVLEGVGKDGSGKPTFLFRNSWGTDKAMAAMNFENACQIMQISAYVGPKGRERLKELQPSAAADQGSNINH